MRVVRTVLYSIDIGSVSVFTDQTDDTSVKTEVSPIANFWLILCASLVCIRAVERGCNNLRFYFCQKTLKIQILDSQSQQKIVALQSN